MHDIMDRVTNISWRTTSGATLGGFQYEYDAAGRIVSRSHPIGVGDRLASYGRARSPSAPQSVVGSYTYDAWGNVVDEEITTSASVLSNIRYRFQGREWSAATGLVNFRMRWYDPETGRWLSKDPIGLSGGLNLYAFCGNTLLNSVDFYGESGLVLFARPTMALRFLLENSPKPILPKPQPLPRISSLLKDWGPGKPIPKGFRPPPKPEGNWHNPFTKKSLHNDMNHPKSFEPHWDYIDTEGNHFRWFPDGRIIPKPLRSFQLPQPNDDEREGVGSAEEKSVRFA